VHRAVQRDDPKTKDENKLGSRRKDGKLNSESRNKFLTNLLQL